MKFFVRVFYRLFFWVVPWWYGFTMRMTRRRRYPEVATYTSPEQIDDALCWGDRWRPDPLRGVLDVVMSPRKFQDRINQGKDKLGDCDDHAVYWATALLKSGLALRAWLGTVWYTEDGKGIGHVVCLFESPAHVYYWADYGNPRPYGGPWGWCGPAARFHTLVAAGMFEVRLKRGEPRLAKRVARHFP